MGLQTFKSGKLFRLTCVNGCLVTSASKTIIKYILTVISVVNKLTLTGNYYCSNYVKLTFR
jgi:hypothetical protein